MRRSWVVLGGERVWRWRPKGRSYWAIVGGKRHWVWRDAKGEFVKWGWKPPVKITEITKITKPEIKLPVMIWRLTVAINNLTRKGKKGVVIVVHKYYSVRVQFWALTREGCEAAVNEATQRVRALAAKVCRHRLWADWNVDDPNVAIQEVLPDPAIRIGEFEEVVEDVT